jgi:hypothetical protein
VLGHQNCFSSIEFPCRKIATSNEELKLVKDQTNTMDLLDPAAALYADRIRDLESNKANSDYSKQ